MRRTGEEDQDDEYAMQEYAAPTNTDAEFGDDEDEDEDAEELVPVETSEGENLGWLVIFWAWYCYIVSLELGWTGGYLVPGAIGFLTKYYLGGLTSFTESSIFMIGSGLSACLGLTNNLIVDSRRATFSPLRFHLEEHVKLQKQLNAYNSHMLRHLANLHDEELLRQYVQCYALNPIIGSTEKKLKIMIGDGEESKRARIKRRYVDASQPGHTAFSIYGIVAAPIGTGGLMCFIALTANAIIGEYIPIPPWFFRTCIFLAAQVGVHAFVTAILNFRNESASEETLIANLAVEELQTQACLDECRETHALLNKVLIEKAKVRNRELAVSDWEPTVPISSVAVFRQQEGGRTTYQSAGFFGLGMGGSKALFPIRPKPPKKRQDSARHEDVNEEREHGTGAGNSGGFG